jgi:hypothetical protein
MTSTAQGRRGHRTRRAMAVLTHRSENVARPRRKTEVFALVPKLSQVQ